MIIFSVCLPENFAVHIMFLIFIYDTVIRGRGRPFTLCSCNKLNGLLKSPEQQRGLWPPQREMIRHVILAEGWELHSEDIVFEVGTVHPTGGGVGPHYRDCSALMFLS